MRLVFAAFILGFALPSQAATQIYGADEYPARLGLEGYLPAAGLSRLKVAVLASGFGDFSSRAAGEYLPARTQLVADYSPEWIARHGLSVGVAGNALNGDRHGLSMAQAVWAAVGQPRETGPQFLLLNANGLTQLRRAIQYAIDAGVDVIQYSENWEYGGNFDGRGFINAAVSQATRAGILWVQAAGNYGGQVYDGPVLTDDQSLRFTNPFDENRVRITVAWNDFAEREDHQTHQDLDAEVWDQDGSVVARGNRVQVPVAGPARGEATLHAREIFTATLDRGEYRIHLSRLAGRFTAASRVRVWIATERPETAVAFTDATRQREVMIPADHPEVITVGDLSGASAQGPTRDERVKPDFVLPNSEIAFTNGLRTSGTSNAAALFAGVVLVLKANDPALTRERLVEQARGAVECLYPIERMRIPEGIWTRLEADTGRPRIQLSAGIARDGRLTVLVPNEPWDYVSFAGLKGLFATQGRPAAAFHFLMNDAGRTHWEARAQVGGSTLPSHWVAWVQQGMGVAVCDAAHPALWITPAPSR